MPKISVGTIVKLLIACLLVGMGMSALDLDPRTVFNESLRLAKQVAEWSIANFGQAVSYIMLGGAVVLPLWLVSYLLRFLRRGKLIAKRFSGSGTNDDGPAAS